MNHSELSSRHLKINYLVGPAEDIQKKEKVLSRGWFDWTKAAIRPVLSLSIYYFTRIDTLNRIKECAFRVFAGSKFNPAAKDPSLSGSNQLSTLPCLSRDLQSYLKLFQACHTEQEICLLKKATGLLKEANDLYYEIAVSGLNNILHGTSYDEPQLALNLVKRIGELEVGSRILVPGGYANRTSYGHKILFEVVRENQTDARFNIFNTGEGAYIDRNKKAHPISFLVSKEAVQDVGFWRKLTHFSIGKSKASTIGDVYGCILEHFVHRHGVKPELLFKHSPQVWDSCAFEPFLVWLKSYLPKDLYRAFRLHMVQKACEELQTLLPLAKESRILQPETIDLIEWQSKETLARLAKKTAPFIRV